MFFDEHSCGAAEDFSKHSKDLLSVGSVATVTSVLTESASSDAQNVTEVKEEENMQNVTGWNMRKNRTSGVGGGKARGAREKGGGG